MDTVIPLLKPSCTDEEIEAVTAVLRSGWWGNGPVCEEFERQVAERAGYKYCITVNSATAALHLALKSLDIAWGYHEVIVPALTFVSTALVASYVGARVVFADVVPGTLTIDWGDVLQKITKRTKAIIPVDYAGYPADGHFASWIPIVEDAAHNSLGEHYGDIVCYSFHPVKTLATGDGGAILTNDPDQASRCRSLRWVGIDRSTWERQEKRYNWDYDIREVGYKYHWNDIQAAIGLVQLKRLSEMNLRRRVIADRYRIALSSSRVELCDDHPRHSNHLFPIRVDADRRNEIIDRMLQRGISVGVHYKPLTYYPMWANHETPPVTYREWRRLISLPIFPDMTDEEQFQVITGLEEALKGR